MPLDPSIWNPALQGPAGEDGRTIHTVSGVPSNSVGVDFDYAIDPLTWTIYGPKEGGVWPAGTVLIGPTGAAGAAGVKGDKGDKGNKGDTGATGTAGSVIHAGTDAPAPEVGVNGDFFLNLTTTQFYGPKTAGSWGVPITLKGIQGIPGEDGSQIYRDVNAPVDGEGLPGDYWWDTFSYTLWGPKHPETGWAGTDVVLKGTKGDKGDPGNDGEDAPIALIHHGQQNVTNNLVTLFVPTAADATLQTNTDYVQVVGIFEPIPHGLNYGVTQQSNQLTITRSGRYLIHLWATLSASVNNPNVGFKFAVNGGITLARRPWVRLGNSGEKSNISAHGFVSLVAGDVVTLYVASTAANNLTINDMVLSLTEMIATGKTGPVQDEGVEILSNPEAINFVGAGVTVTEDPTGVVKVTIPGGSGGPVTSADYIGFNLAAGHSVAEGEIAWNAIEKTFDMGMEGGPVLQVGQEQYLRAYNNTGSTILNGKAVYITGSSGGMPTVDLADATGPVAHKTIAMATADIPDVTNGYFTTYGKVRNLDTSTWAPGTELWLDPASPGGMTSTKPEAPNRIVKLGYVIVQDPTVGVILVTIEDQPDFVELADVDWTGASAGAIPRWNGTKLLPETTAPYDMAFYVSGVQPGNKVIFKFTFTRDVEFPDDFAGSDLHAGVAATAEFVYTVKKNGSDIGTITVAAAGTSGTFVTTGGATSFAANDVLELVTQTTADATLANVSITLSGTRDI